MCVRLVCRSRRQAADKTPDLWTKIFVAPVAGKDVRQLTDCELADRELAKTHLFLKNSYAGKLDVCLELNQSPQHEVILAETLGQLHRIRDLQLLRKGPSAPDSIELILNTPAPCLEALVIDMSLEAAILQDGTGEEADQISKNGDLGGNEDGDEVQDNEELDDAEDKNDKDVSENENAEDGSGDETEEDGSEDESEPDGAG